MAGAKGEKRAITTPRINRIRNSLPRYWAKMPRHEEFLVLPFRYTGAGRKSGTGQPEGSGENFVF